MCVLCVCVCVCVWVCVCVVMCVCLFIELLVSLFHTLQIIQSFTKYLQRLVYQNVSREHAPNRIINKCLEIILVPCGVTLPWR